MEMTTYTTDEEWTLVRVALGVLLSSVVRRVATEAVNAFALGRFEGVDAHRGGMAAAAAA